METLTKLLYFTMSMSWVFIGLCFIIGDVTINDHKIISVKYLLGIIFFVAGVYGALKYANGN